MPATHRQALVDARKLVRTLGSAPDPRRRAEAVIAELSRAEGWSAAARHEIDVVARWLKADPAPAALQPRLRALLAQLA